MNQKMIKLKNALAFIESRSNIELARRGDLLSSSSKKIVPKELYNSLELKNAIADAGYEVDITTLTQIKQKIVKQKFYEVAPAKFVDIKIGEGAFMEELLTWKEFSDAGDFESGNIDQATNNSRIASVDSRIEAVKTPIISWAKSVGYSLFEVQQASKGTKTWSKIESIERSRKRNWDLGIQRITFLGAKNDSSVTGLLNNATVTTNTTTITKLISSMTDTEFQTFVSTVLKDFDTNSNGTSMPNVFAIPQSDWLGLGKATSASYPINTRVEYLLMIFKMLTGNPNFQILPLKYGDTGFNDLGKTKYALYNKNPDVLDMNLPVDYTSTAIGTVNGFQWQNVAYGQYTGVEIYRPREVLYYEF
jgi:hypothetical protein